MYKEYKAQRDAMPDELRGQFALVRQILATFDIPIVEMEGQEADDVIATLARQVEDAGEHTDRRHRRSRSPAARRRVYDGVDDAPRDHGSRTLRRRGGARALRFGTFAAPRLSRAQGRSVRQPSRHSRRRRKDRNEAASSGGFAGCAGSESGVGRNGEAASAHRAIRRSGATLPHRLDRSSRSAAAARSRKPVAFARPPMPISTNCMPSWSSKRCSRSCSRRSTCRFSKPRRNSKDTTAALPPPSIRPSSCAWPPASASSRRAIASPLPSSTTRSVLAPPTERASRCRWMR